MPILAVSPGLAALQDYVRQLREERGFDQNSIERDCLLFGEEVGELFAAVCTTKNASTVDEVAGEIADIQIYLCTIANHFGVDLQAAPALAGCPDLTALQHHVRQRQRHRSSNTTIRRDCLALGQETGKLFKAVRKACGMPIDAASDTSTVAGALARIQIRLLTIANHFGIDLETAFREKEKVNKRRTWQVVAV